MSKKLKKINKTKKRNSKLNKILAASVGLASTLTATAEAAIVTLANASTSKLAQIAANDVIVANNNLSAAIINLDTDITFNTFTSAGAGQAFALTIVDTSAGGNNTLKAAGVFTVATNNVELIMSGAADEHTLEFASNVVENTAALIIDLDENTILKLSGTSTAVAGVVDGQAAFEGDVNLTGTVTMGETVGAINGVESVNFTGNSVITGIVKALAINVATSSAKISVATDVFADVVTVTSGKLTLFGDHSAKTGAGTASSTVLTAATSTIAFENTAANEAIETNITGATANKGIIQIASNHGNAARVTTLSGTIGTNTVRVNSLVVGATQFDGTNTAGGSVILGGASFINSATVTGGDAAAEDSVLAVAANTTFTDGISLVSSATADATLSLATNNVVLTSDVTGTKGTANVIVAASGGGSAVSTITGDITGVTNLTVADASKLTLKGSTITSTNTILSGATSVLTLDGTVDQTVTNAVTVAGIGEGKIVVENTTVAAKKIFASTVGAEAARVLDIQIDDNAEVEFQDVVHARTLDIDSNGEVVTFQKAGNIIGQNGGIAGDLEIAAGARIRLGTAIVAGDTVFQTKESAGDAGSVLIAGDITVIPSSNFTSGTITFVDGATAAVTTGERDDILLQDTFLTDYTVATDLKDITITATGKSAANISGALGVTVNEARGLSQVMESAKATDTALFTALNTALVKDDGTTDKVQVKAFAEQLGTQTDMLSGSTAATRAVTGSVQGIVSNRMASLRSGDAYASGISAGNSMSANSGFFQVFGSDTTQKSTQKKGGVQAGYDAESTGFAVGFDGQTSNGSVLGLSLSYSETDVTGKGAGKATNDVESYTASLYADHATNKGYIEGSLTFGTNDNSAKRKISTAGISRTLTANYDSEQVSLKVGGGVPNELSDGTFVTPFGSITATTIETDAYTEKSTTAGDATTQTVTQDDLNSLVASIGTRIHKNTEFGTPSISLAINNEFGDTAINASNKFVTGGNTYKTSTETEELSGTLGLGYTYDSDGGLTSINVGYEAETNSDDYLSHYGAIKLVTKF